MTPSRLLAALALGVALCRPSAALPDRYGDRSRAAATDTTEADRQKRAYTSWTGYEDLTRWKPPVYQLSRPYFIPVYGAPGRVPIFFPPQKLHLNPGTPLDNPLPHRPFSGPGYLPPATEKPSSSTTMKVVNRFNDDEEEDDRPVWGGSQPSKESQIIPTRPPRPSGLAEFPPLVHDVNAGGATNQLVAQSEDEQSKNVISVTTARVIASGPSNCAWAIVSCCSASSSKVPDKCFEQRGCPGPFWGSSPCESDYAKAAIDAALNYYRQ